MEYKTLMEDRVTGLVRTPIQDHEIFVFGSNNMGHHGAGAALLAKKYFGAETGKGVGLMGQCYGLVTIDWTSEYRPLTPDEIRPYVDDLELCVADHPHLMFLITEVGCGLAGNKVEDIAPLFKAFVDYENVRLPYSFWLELGYLDRKLMED